jgi:hypothetical protein
VQESFGVNMAKRNKNFNEVLANQMKDFEFAQGYLLTHIEEHEDRLQDALIASCWCIYR